jgi:hypothetical protein
VSAWGKIFTQHSKLSAGSSSSSSSSDASSNDSRSLKAKRKRRNTEASQLIACQQAFLYFSMDVDLILTWLDR